MTKATTILASLALVAAVACTKADKSKTQNKAAATKKVEAKKAQTASADKIKRLSPDELEKQLTSSKVFDCNNEMTRKKYGKIPGAVLLSSSSDYKLDVLPKDKTKPVVFYCSNPLCGASHRGAKRAVVAGYADVSVLPVGIIGWAKAGKKTETIQ